MWTTRILDAIISICCTDTYCQKTGQLVPQTKGEILRCILESFALKYRFVLERTEKLVQ
jgi:sugar (pentulose or hexulose) kinase